MKGNPFFNTMAGKLGEVVFYRAKGEQRGRTYLKKINNPKTGIQMANRTNLANLVNFYRLSRNLIASAFTDKKGRQSDYNAFVSANKSSKPVYLTKEEASVKGYVILAPYTISSGILSTIASYGYDSSTNRFFFRMSGLQTGATPEQMRSAYMASFSDASETDSLVLITYQAIETSFIMKSYDIDVADDSSLTSNLTIGLVGGTQAVFLSNSAGAAASVLIRCRKENGKLLVSTQSVILSDDWLQAYEMASSELKAREAAASYGSTTQNILPEAADNSGYFNYKGITDTKSGTPVYNPTFASLGNSPELYAIIENYLKNDNVTFEFSVLKGFETTGISKVEVGDPKPEETKTDGILRFGLTGEGVASSVAADFPATINVQAIINGKRVNLGNITYTAK